MKYRIIETTNEKTSTKGYIVQVTIAGDMTKFLNKSFIIKENGNHDGLIQVDNLELSYDYTIFDSLEEAEACLNQFATENPFHCEKKKIVKEGIL